MAPSMRWRTRNPPSCHQPWVSPVSSRTLAGSLKKIWQETEKTSGSAKPSSSGARNPASTRMSLFSSTTTSFLAARKPAFDPPPKPRLAGRARSFTCGNAARTKSALPSVEPLSTTTISFSGLPSMAAATEGRYFSSSSLLFQLGMTTEAAVGRGRGGRSGAPGRRPQWSASQRTSVAASAAAAATTSSGDSSSRGSARRTRFRKGMSTGRQVRAQAHPAAQLHPAGGAVQGRLFSQPARFLLQLERPGGPLLEFLFGEVQLRHRGSQRLGLPLHVGGERGGPLRFGADVGLQFRHFGGVAFGRAERAGLLAGELLLQLHHAGAALFQFLGERGGPFRLGVHVGFQFRHLGGVAFGRAERAGLLAGEVLLQLHHARAAVFNFPVKRG